MLKVHYAPGPSISDFDIEDVFERLKSDITSDKTYNVTFSTENIFLRIRVAIHEKEISYNNVEFYFNDAKVPINKDGTIDHWPVGFLDTNESLLYRLFGE